MKVILTNTVLLNGGDAGIMLAIKKAFEDFSGEPVRFLVCDSKPAIVRRYYQDVPIRGIAFNEFMGKSKGLRRSLKRGRLKLTQYLLSWLLRNRGRDGVLSRLLPRAFREQIQAYSDADVMISTGGTYLVENYSLTPRFFEFDVARALGIPLVLYTQSLGPFTSRRIRRRMKRMLNYATMVFLRDERSLGYLLEMGADPKKCRVCADTVFGLYEPKPKPLRASRQNPAVAVSLRTWHFFETKKNSQGMVNYLRSVGAAISHLVERCGAQVTLVSTCQGVPEYWTDDSGIAQQVYKGYLTDAVRAKVVVDDQFRSGEEFVEYLRQFDFTISTRLHFGIFSMLAGVPTLPIAYQFKTTELFKSIGLAKWIEDIETISPESLVAKTADFWERIDEMEQRLNSEMPKLRESALEAAKATLQHLGKLCQDPAVPPAAIPRLEPSSIR